MRKKKWITDDNQTTLRRNHTTGANPFLIPAGKATNQKTATFNPEKTDFKTGTTAIIAFKTETTGMTGIIVSKTGMNEMIVFKAIKIKIAAAIEPVTTVFKAATIALANRMENFNREIINFKAKSHFFQKGNQTNPGKMTTNRASYQICK